MSVPSLPQVVLGSSSIYRRAALSAILAEVPSAVGGDAAAVAAAVGRAEAVAVPEMKAMGDAAKAGAADASAAPAVPFRVLAPDIDEKAVEDRAGDTSAEVVSLAVARAKAAEVLRRLGEEEAEAGGAAAAAGQDLREALVVTCDSVALAHGEVREKPRDEAQAREFLRGYDADHPLRVVCGVVVTDRKTGQAFDGSEGAQQWFSGIGEDDITALIEKKVVMTSCGGFAIEHMEKFDHKREGNVSCVMGFPVKLVLELVVKALAARTAAEAEQA